MKLLLIVVFVIPFFAHSQCPPDSTFTSQAEIDAFATEYPDCTELGGMVIEGDDITNLSGLSQIQTAVSLQVKNNPMLETLNGLNTNLIFFGEHQHDFLIENNDLLYNISALSNASVGAGVDLYINVINNPSLSSLNGLQCLT